MGSPPLFFFLALALCLLPFSSAMNPAMCRRFLDANDVGSALEAPFEAASFSAAGAYGTNTVRASKAGRDRVPKTVSRRTKDGILVEQDLDDVLLRLRSACTSACVSEGERLRECDVSKGLLKSLLGRVFRSGFVVEAVESATGLPKGFTDGSEDLSTLSLLRSIADLKCQVCWSDPSSPVGSTHTNDDDDDTAEGGDTVTTPVVSTVVAVLVVGGGSVGLAVVVRRRRLVVVATLQEQAASAAASRAAGSAGPSSTTAVAVKPDQHVVAMNPNVEHDAAAGEVTVELAPELDTDDDDTFLTPRMLAAPAEPRMPEQPPPAGGGRRPMTESAKKRRADKYRETRAKNAAAREAQREAEIADRVKREYAASLAGWPSKAFEDAKVGAAAAYLAEKAKKKSE